MKYFHIYFPLCFLALKYIFYKFYNVVLISTVSEVKVAESCLTLCDSMDCSPPGASIHGLLQARLLEWVAVFFSKFLLHSKVNQLCTQPLVHSLVSLFLMAPALCCWAQAFSRGRTQGSSLAAVHALLIAVAAPVVGRRL